MSIVLSFVDMLEVLSFTRAWLLLRLCSCTSLFFTKYMLSFFFCLKERIREQASERCLPAEHKNEWLPSRGPPSESQPLDSLQRGQGVETDLPHGFV